MLCEKLAILLEPLIISDDIFKVTLKPFFVSEFSLLKCELNSFTFTLLYWVILHWCCIKAKQILNTLNNFHVESLTFYSITCRNFLNVVTCCHLNGWTKMFFPSIIVLEVFISTFRIKYLVYLVITSLPPNDKTKNLFPPWRIESIN